MKAHEAVSHPIFFEALEGQPLLQEITIHKFRNVEPKTTLRFHPRMSVLLGKNATGKTSLLALISALLRGDYSAYSGHGETLSVDFLLQKGSLSLRGEVRTAEDPARPPHPPKRLLYEDITLLKNNEPFFCICRESPSSPAFSSLSLPSFGVASTRKEYAALLRPGEEGGEISRVLDSFSWDVPRFGENLAGTLFVAEDDPLPASVANPEFCFPRKAPTSLPTSLRSDGQKRLLSLLVYLEKNPSFAILDEMTTGLHPDWIEWGVGALENHQSFLASQHPCLLDSLWFASSEEAQQTFVLCEAVQSEGGETLRWRQMSDLEAFDFYKSYKVGFQHVSEILRSKGLW